MSYLRKKDYKKMDLLFIIEQAQNSDWEALEELLRRHSGMIYSTLYHIGKGIDNIDDLSQEVLMRIAKSIYTLKKKENFKTWMNQIIYNVFYDEMRRRKKKPNIASIDNYYDDSQNFQGKEIEDMSMHPDDKLNTAELNHLIRTSIRGLEEPFREVIVLRELQGLSYDKIARILDTNLGTVKSRIARARMRLQHKLKDYLD